MRQRFLPPLLAILVLTLFACGGDSAQGKSRGDDATHDADLDASRADADAPSLDADANASDGAQDADAPTANECETEAQRAVDTDVDGVPDCEEAEFQGGCLDPEDTDTDDDGLSDYEEFSLGTNPCSADSDADGLSDADEIYFGLDPGQAATYGAGRPDATLDSELYIARACDPEQVEAEPVELHQFANGDWLLALPSIFDYAPLTIASGAAGWGIAVFDDSTAQVSGFALSVPKTVGAGSALDELLSYKFKIQGANVSLLSTLIEGEFSTHDNYAAAPGVYRVKDEVSRSVKWVRDELLFALSSFGPTELTGLPPTAGNAHSIFFVQATVVERSDRLIALVALAPDALRETDETVRFRLADVTNTTNLARAADDTRLRCHPFPIDTATPAADFYWVLDQSVSMVGYYDEMYGFASDFYAKLENTALDFRLAVAPMDDQIGGKIRLPPEGPGWIEPLTASLQGGAADFIEEIRQYVVRCVSLVPGCSDFEEFGLYASSRGIERMKSSFASPIERLRPHAQLATILMSDEEDESYENPLQDPRGLMMRPQVVDYYDNFFRRNPLLFAIYSPKDDPCYDAEGSIIYPEIALASGGASASLCEDLEGTIDKIMEITIGRASTYVLPSTPISSTLRVYQTTKDGREPVWVPRSRVSGFDYSSRPNAISFFGDYRPPHASRDACMKNADCTDANEVCRASICVAAAPFHVAVHYRSFRKLKKDDPASGGL